MTAYYNEIDPQAAQWLRNLIAEKLIAPGDVDERSIEDVKPGDLRGYRQCHFFAGIGGWSLALRLAGWSDDRPAWTGSCPCQPFSAAGKGAGFEDERHLWPSFFHLIQQCNPAVVFGEQVASAAVGPWIDLVFDDLEAMGYACGAYAGPAAGVGAPHLRDRSYWLGYADHARLEGLAGNGGAARREGSRGSVAEAGVSGWVGDAACEPRERIARGVSREEAPQHRARIAVDGHLSVGSEHAGSGVALWLADADGGHASAERQQRSGEQRQQPADGGAVGLGHADGKRQGAIGGFLQGSQPESERGRAALGLAYSTSSGRREERSHDGRGAFGDRSQGLAAGLVDGGGDHGPGPLHGFWRAADWLLCRDGKWRPVEPGSFPLAHGIPGRVGRLRGYGNAIVPQQAAEFVRAFAGCLK